MYKIYVMSKLEEPVHADMNLRHCELTHCVSHAAHGQVPDRGC